MRHFVITIDTEGDNLWHWKPGDEITTRNVQYLDRFQKLCNEFGFKPVWLSNWEMINDSAFVQFINQGLEQGQCELGMHLHAWNNPPYYELKRTEKSGAPYLIEYPDEIMEQKIATITDRFKEQFGFVPLSHRAGRWAMDDRYFKLLYQYGYRIDCSYTPGISWTDSVGQTPGYVGSDYRKVPRGLQQIHGITEVPVTTSFTHHMFVDRQKSLKSNLKSIVFGMQGQSIWLRPNRENRKELSWMIDQSLKREEDYLMFMLHSSELMPGGSPTFRNEEEIAGLYQTLHNMFCRLQGHYVGCTLQEYVQKHNARISEKQGEKQS